MQIMVRSLLIPAKLKLNLWVIKKEQCGVETALEYGVVETKEGIKK
jgi:hypothetical protein